MATNRPRGIGVSLRTFTLLVALIASWQCRIAGADYLYFQPWQDFHFFELQSQCSGRAQSARAQFSVSVAESAAVSAGRADGPIPRPESRDRQVLAVQLSSCRPPSRSPSPTGPPPALPGTPPGPIVSTPTFSWEGLPDTDIQPPTPDIAVGPNDALMVVNSNIGQFTKAGVMKKLTSFQDWFSDVLASTCPFELHRFRSLDCLRSTARPFSVSGERDARQSAVPHASPTSYSPSRTELTYDGGWKNWALNASLDGTVSDAELG